MKNKIANIDTAFMNLPTKFCIYFTFPLFSIRHSI
jgi:hypothetical protein